MNKRLTAENLKNLNDGETIETPHVRFDELVCSCYSGEYLSNDGYDKAWTCLCNHRTQ